VVNEDQEKTKKTKVRDLLAKLGPKAKDKLRRSCTRKLLFKKFPVLNWLPKYTAPDAVGDLVAGFTVGLTMIPQALAYANIAGLPVQVNTPCKNIHTVKI
jgi:sodium-independent sulfate anion transporter 11